MNSRPCATGPTTLCVALVLVLFPRSVLAQDDRCEDGVAELSEEGADLFEDGNFLGAASILEAAYSCDPVDALLFDIGRAYQEAGRCVAASNAFRNYLETGDSTARAQAMDYEAAAADCASRYEAAMARADAERSEGNLGEALDHLATAVSISEEPVARIVYGETLIDTGRCNQAVEVLSQLPMEFLSETQLSIVEMDLERADTDCGAEVDCDERQRNCLLEQEEILADHEEGTRTQRLVGLGLTGGGALVLLGAVVHDLLSQPVLDDLDAASDEGDVEAYDALREQVSGRRTASLVLYGTGSLLFLTGTVMWLSSLRAAPGGDVDCGALCWNVEFNGPSGATGLWIGGEF